MRVLYFGSYNKNHPRNKILINGLRALEVEVIEVHDRSRNFFRKSWRLFRQHWPYRHTYQTMIVGFPGFVVVPLAKLIATAPIVFDAFVSYYDANVFDRGLASPGSFKARYFYFLDWFSCRLSDIVLLETHALIEYFVKTFKLSRTKFRRILIGADNTIFKPATIPKIPNFKFQILFWGYMIPSHGIPYVLEAAKILAAEDLEFVFIGGGAQKAEMLKLKERLNLLSVKFLDALPQNELLPFIHRCDVALGAFGDLPRLKMVVTNKVYEAIACGKALITANEGAKEILADRVHCLFCRPADPEDLAEKILELKNNPSFGKALARNGRKLYEENFTPAALGGELLAVLERL